MNFFDFNTAPDQHTVALIPHGTMTQVSLHIRPGGYNDQAQGWEGGWATKNESSGAIYLNCEFTVLAGLYQQRKIWSLIGLYSPKGAEWGLRGRSFIKAILHSANGIQPLDQSPAAQQARLIYGFEALEGLEFLAKIEVEKASGNNVIKTALMPGHPDYPGLLLEQLAPRGSDDSHQDLPTFWGSDR